MSIYEPLTSNLEKRSIRILTLLPESLGYEIQTVLEIVGLDDGYQYEAVSYSWGPSTPKYRIKCNGISVEVYPNLFKALKRFRDPKDARHLWIDALCIDQSNVEEKNKQIPMMRDIYQRAKQTLIWLGEGNARTQAGLSMVPSFIHAQELRLRNNDSRPWHSLSHSDWERYHLPDPNLGHWNVYEAFAEVWASDWFGRVWIIQEQAVSSNCIIFCGVYWVSWETFTSIFDLFANLAIYRRMSGKQNAINNVMSLLVSRKQFSEGKLQPLMWHLTSHFGSQSTNPRDKIYALCGISSDTGPEGLNVRFDYGSEVSKIYTNIAILHLEKYRTFEILEVPRHMKRSGVDGLPTWCPDWSIQDALTAPLRINCLKEFLDDFSPQTFVDSDWYNYDSGKGSVPCFSVSADHRRLMVRAVRVCRLEFVGELCDLKDADPPKATPQESGTYFKEKLDRLKRKGHLFQHWAYDIARTKKESLYPTGESMLDCFAITLIAGTHQKHSIVIKYFQHWWKNFLMLGRLPDNLILSAIYIQMWSSFRTFSSILKFKHSHIETQSIRSANAQTYDQLIAVCNQRRLARTDNGLLALVPGPAMKGDEVVIFAGGKAPFIVRRRMETPLQTCGSEFAFVGEAYVYGIMNGEAFDTTRLEDITLI
ncbi:HET-domain-containing protein [Patellaria atrata CBS 101060]|uniref:HET-domain-containing protein n=1 Tax=Patellaria atrata CBS 101060 TaxID=1346257 RepID=A0A9P4S7I7_9PEZI|nr:HET-domain-containing protein [Patellaria atrata CBS 101060]